MAEPQTSPDTPIATKPECAKAPRIKVENHTSAGFFWFTAWLFTVGYLHLTFWKGVLALLLWPYFIGLHISTLVH